MRFVIRLVRYPYVKIIAILCFFALCCPSVASPARAEAISAPFADIGGSYAKEAILRLYDQNLIDGTGSGLFEPYKTLTRAELATMIVRLFRLEPVNGAIPAFKDVPANAWYYPWIQAAVHTGIASGVPSERFAPKRAVTRQDAAVLIARAAKLSGGQVSNLQAYADQRHIASYALPSVMRLKELGLMQGDGNLFRPEHSMTRQEAAVLLDKVLQRPGWQEQLQIDPPEKIHMGWQYGQTTAQYLEQVSHSLVNTLSPRWFFLDSGGFTVSGYDASLVEWAHQRGKQVWPMVGNRFNQENTHAMLKDEAKRKKAVEQLVNEVKEKRLDGLNVDFENVAAEDRSAYTAFISELAQAMDAVPAVLSVDLSPDSGTDWTEAYDYAALGRAADYIVLMGYDEHWNGSPTAGSVSSLPWLKKGLDKLVAQVPAGKAILAMPLYTRDWTLHASSPVASADKSLVQQNETVRSRSLSPKWNSTLGQYTVEYRVSGTRHAIWLEDGRSLSAKADLGEQYGIAGYAYWHIGGESLDIWDSLRNRLRYASYDFR